MKGKISCTNAWFWIPAGCIPYRPAVKYLEDRRLCPEAKLGIGFPSTSADTATFRGRFHSWRLKKKNDNSVSDSSDNRIIKRELKVYWVKCQLWEQNTLCLPSVKTISCALFVDKVILVNTWDLMRKKKRKTIWSPEWRACYYAVPLNKYIKVKRIDRVDMLHARFSLVATDLKKSGVRYK